MANLTLSRMLLPKPRIHPIYGNHNGRAGQWLCVGAGTYGYGSDAPEAYRQWLQARDANNQRIPLGSLWLHVEHK